MRLQVSRKIHYEAGPNMTPLVDVVMVILIFMMLAGSFGGAEHYLMSNMPIVRNGAGKPAGGAFDDVTLDVRVDSSPENPDIWVAKFGDVRTSSPSQLMQAMKTKLDDYTRNGTDLKHLQVIINPNRLVKWKSLIAVYQAANEAGYGRITFNQSH
jgi:biopolymer transport protein ExbD